MAKYLDNTNLPTLWNKTKAYADSRAASNVNGWAYCGTSSSTAAKTVSISGIKTLITGTVITIRFGYAIDTANSTLNVSSTGAKPIYYNNKPLSIGAIQADDIVSFVYYSSRWQVIGSLNQAGIATEYFNSLDFNKYTVAGRYIIHRSGSETMLNGPGSQMSGWLDVMVNQDVITQIMTDFNGRLINIRGFYQSWGKWVTYSGAGSPTVGSALNFKSGTVGIARNLSTQQMIGNRCFADISFQTNAAITAYTRMYFTGYYTPTTDNDTRLLVYDTGIQFQVSCSVYNNAFYIIPTLNISPGWHRFQFSYQTTGEIHP